MMIFRKEFTVLLSLLFAVTLTFGEMEKDTQDIINQSLGLGATALDTISKFEPKWHIKAIQTILDKAVFEKLAGCLGAIGGVVSFVLLFVPTGDSAELKYMKKKFAEVNQKLDLMAKDLDGIKDLVEYHSVKSAYLTHAFKIQYASKQLEKMLNKLQRVRCTNKNDCNRKRVQIAQGYVKDFDIKRSWSLILTGTVSRISEFGKPLLELINKVYKGDINRINHFINSIFTLSFQAQRAILVYDKLKNTQTSISESMLSWLKQMYHLRKTGNRFKLEILKDIVKYMQDDINDQKYQVKYSNNLAVVRDMKKFLLQKYPWCHWIVYTYMAYGEKKHAFTTKGADFFNMPKDENKRKRVIIAVPQRRGGTFEYQRKRFREALDDIIKAHDFAYEERDHAFKLYDVFLRLLKQRNVWKLLRSFAILTDIKDFNMDKDERSFLNYFDEEIEYYSWCENKYGGKESRCKKRSVRIVAVFKSQEEIEYTKCTKSCSGRGKCRAMPLTAEMYCECDENYQGDNCESKSKADVAKNIEEMLKMALHIPQLSDVYFDIKEMRDILGISLKNIQNALSVLDAKILKAFDIVGAQIDSNFKWANLLTVYSHAVEMMMYFVQLIVETQTQQQKGLLSPQLANLKLRRISKLLLRKDKLPYWLFLLDKLFRGRNDAMMMHKPLLMMVMEKYRSSACTSQYKKTVYNVWKQMQNLQFHSYILWIQASDLLNRDSSLVVWKFKKTIKSQNNYLATKTCRLNIPNSVNAQCDGKFSIFKGMTINLQCRRNYYIYGTKTPSCQRPSQCRFCNCDKYGSVSQQCNANGNCRCKSNFYGNKCNKRNCKWGSWGGWRSCSKHCDYGGYQYRYRYHAVRRYGGGASCSGSSYRRRSCFNRCCSHQFHCSNRRKCISNSMKCNYKNDCGDNQDENGCRERCSWRYSRYDYDGKGQIVYLDRQRPSCYSGEMMSSFALKRRSRGSRYIRYQFKCCRPYKDICSSRSITNRYTDYKSYSAVYLGKQYINCGYKTGFLQAFGLKRYPWRKRRPKKIRYSYNCCTVRSYWKSRMSCYESATGYTYDGNGKIYYLDRQTVSCGHRYFLNYVHLETISRRNRWRYRYRCCKVNP